MFTTLHSQYLFCMMRQCVQMYIQFCGPRQMNNTKKLDKCPYEMQMVKFPNQAWKQIGNQMCE